MFSLRSLFLAALWLSCRAAAAVEPGVLETAAEVRVLSLEEALKQRPVRLKAVVTIVGQGTVFYQDETGGTFTPNSAITPKVEPGDRISVEGVSYKGLYVPGVKAEKMEVIGKAPLPTAQSVGFAHLASGRSNYEWVEVRGIIRAVDAPENGQVVLTLAMGDGRLELHCLKDDSRLAALVDAAVRVQGLAAGFYNDRRQLVAPQLLLNGIENITIEDPAPEDPWALPITPALQLLKFSAAAHPGHRVKVRGVVIHQQLGQALFLRDGEQGLLVQTHQEQIVQVGDVVEALGYPTMGRFSALLEDGAFTVTGSQPPPIPLRVQSALSGNMDGDLVRLHGTLLESFSHSNELTLILQSEGAIFNARLNAPDASRPILRSGSTLELTGICQIVQAEPQSRFNFNPRSFEILLRTPADITVLKEASWWNARRLSFGSGVILLLLLLVLAWNALLRRQVRRQTALIAEGVQAAATTEERQRIAREFHDTLEQELVGLALRLDALGSKILEGKPRELLQTARHLLQRLQEEARDFVWNLRESQPDPEDLPAAIRSASANLCASSNLQLEVRSEGPLRRWPAPVERHLLRVTQEAATNAVKHGHATHLRITLLFTPEALHLEIVDNGLGFDPAAPTKPGGHFGIIGMRERLRKIGAQFQLRSAPGQGTSILIDLPARST